MTSSTSSTGKQPPMSWKIFFLRKKKKGSSPTVFKGSIYSSVKIRKWQSPICPEPQSAEPWSPKCRENKRLQNKTPDKNNTKLPKCHFNFPPFPRGQRVCGQDIKECCASSGQRGHHRPAEVGENQTGDSGGSLWLGCPQQTPAGPAEGRTAHPQQQQHRRCVWETHGRGEWRDIVRIVS